MGFKPNGMGEQKPNHYADMAKIVWQNRQHLPYAWRILRKGVCDGCALGVAGFHDWTLSGVHLCTTRLNLLRVNTMPALDPAVLADVKPLRKLSGARAARSSGRLPYPMVRRARRAGLPAGVVGRGARPRRGADPGARPGAVRALPHGPRHHQRGVLRRARR